MRVTGLCLAPAILIASAGAIRANDAARANAWAPDVAAGGLELRGKPRVSINKERLSIVKLFDENDDERYNYRITAVYDLVNESKRDVVEEIAFPIREFGVHSLWPRESDEVKGLAVEVNGRVQPYAMEIRAVGDTGRDVTRLLEKAGIDLWAFGGFEESAAIYDGKREGFQVDLLSPAMKARLLAAGAVREEEDDPYYRTPRYRRIHLRDADLYKHALVPAWDVDVTYHWKQSFPAGRHVVVKHEYDAVHGTSFGRGVVRGYLANLDRFMGKGCFQEGLIHDLEDAADPISGEQVYSDWVRYKLRTTATWKMPVRDFELTIDAPDDVSFCWDGPVQQLSESRWRATARGFTPKKDLLVYFLAPFPTYELTWRDIALMAFAALAAIGLIAGIGILLVRYYRGKRKREPAPR